MQKHWIFAGALSFLCATAFNFACPLPVAAQTSIPPDTVFDLGTRREEVRWEGTISTLDATRRTFKMQVAVQLLRDDMSLSLNSDTTNTVRINGATTLWDARSQTIRALDFSQLRRGAEVIVVGIEAPNGTLSARLIAVTSGSIGAPVRPAPPRAANPSPRTIKKANPAEQIRAKQIPAKQNQPPKISRPPATAFNAPPRTLARLPQQLPAAAPTVSPNSDSSKTPKFAISSPRDNAARAVPPVKPKIPVQVTAPTMPANSTKPAPAETVSGTRPVPERSARALPVSSGLPTESAKPRRVPTPPLLAPAASQAASSRLSSVQAPPKLEREESELNAAASTAFNVAPLNDTPRRVPLPPQITAPQNAQSEFAQNLPQSQSVATGAMMGRDASATEQESADAETMFNPRTLSPQNATKPIGTPRQVPAPVQLSRAEPANVPASTLSGNLLREESGTGFNSPAPATMEKSVNPLTAVLENEKQQNEARARLAAWRAQQEGLPFLYFSGGLETEKLVALTFDDGPHPQRTPQLLDLLKAEKVPATFFVIGRNVEEHPEILLRTVAEGHDLGNHTFQHRQGGMLSHSEWLEEISATNRAIEKIVGVAPRWFRAPGCRYNGAALRVIEELGMIRADSTNNSGDWDGREAATIYTHVINQLKPGNVLLFHDAAPGTLRAMPRLIQEIRARGYTFVTLTELARRAHQSPGFTPAFRPPGQGIVITE